MEKQGLEHFNIFYFLLLLFFKIYFIAYAIGCPNLFPFLPLHPVPPFTLAITALSSCQWVMHVSSLATPFPLLILTSSCLYLPICSFNPYAFSLFCPSPLLTDNPANDCHIYDSVSVLFVCFVY